jgi:small GTP-binding protein
MMGAAGCGKTTLLYQLRLGIAITTIPTIGYNIETLAIQGREITIWDIGGDWSYRHGHWRHYISGADGIIFVVDSSDQLQINEAKVALRGFYREYEAQLKRSVLLVFANKQDRLDALSVAEVKDKLGLEAMQSEGRRWHIHGSIARSGDGLIDAMEWMSTQIR